MGREREISNPQEVKMSQILNPLMINPTSEGRVKSCSWNFFKYFHYVYKSLNISSSLS